MITDPFRILRKFSSELSVCFFTKDDAIGADGDIARAIGSMAIASLKQAHGNRCVLVREPTSRSTEADGLFTDAPGLTLTIRFADCQNFILYAPTRRVVGLVHAGWRGVQKKILTRAFGLLKTEWDIRPADVFVAAGPSLCTSCADFTDPAQEVPELRDFIRGKTIDLRAAAESELRSIGVDPKKFERLPECTRCHPETYWTYRGGDRDAVLGGKTNCLAVTLIR